ncbi:MAG: hypothetical protein FWC10_08990 [Lentimicrobiaceae bacterium]|nr:hypothetical protein [Lentimicrobiaceae bacterium]
MSIKIEEAEEVIKKLANKFDTHKFIVKYIRMYGNMLNYYTHIFVKKKLVKKELLEMHMQK